MRKSLFSLPALALLAMTLGLGAGDGPHAARSPTPVPRLHANARRPVMAPHIPGPRFDTSQNWCGYVDTGNNVTEVAGTWTVPTLTASSCADASSATWVGIDGWTDNTVEQLGTEQDIINSVQSSYAWTELYPHRSVVIGSVSPGATITASVHYNVANGTFTLQMTSPGINFSTTQKLPQARRTSAEWIVEAPFSGGTLPIADFGAVSFNNCSTTVGGTLEGPSSGIPVTMVSESRKIGSAHDLAEPVTAGSNSCTMKWDACQ